MASESPDADVAQQEATWSENRGYDGAEDEAEHASTQHSDEQTENPDLSDAPAADDAPGDGSFETESENDDPADDGMGDYDPEAAVTIMPAAEDSPAPQTSLNPSPQPLAKKPKTAGGFLVGDSDSEDDDASTPASNGRLAEPHGPGRSMTRSPLHNATSASAAPTAPTFQPGAPEGASLHNQDGASAALASMLGSKPPQDTADFLEARIGEDPRGAMDAWLGAIGEYRRRNNIDEARSIYNRFLETFPQAADIWVAYIEMELGLGNFVEAEQLFGQSLMSVSNVQLWTVYLDYIRRRNDLSDSSGQARQTVTQSYEFVIDNIGLDKDSGRIWADYIQFIRFAPGTTGGSSWQDQQKMDQLRKAYQRAICVPISNVNTLWKEYDQFEMGLNKMTGRKFLAERSPGYMSAKSANTAMDNIMKNLNRTSLPRLPPAPGFDGDAEYMEQVDLWKRWIAFEKSDPLDLAVDEPELLKKRILYCYKQALMALRFWPETWVGAAEWCFENDMTKDGKDIGLDFLTEGIAANPESVLLALKHADRIEMTYAIEEGDDAKVARGSAVRAPYTKVLDTLYDMVKSLKDREKEQVRRIEETVGAAIPAIAEKSGDDEDDGDASGEAAKTAAAKQEKIKFVQQGFAAQTQLLSRTISFVWIALARAMRRIQGKGNPSGVLGGLRQVFTEARQRGRLTSDVYVAVAQLEWNVYKDHAGAKIFERGAKLFPEDEVFMIEYLKFLHSRDDFTNARVVFETCVNKLTQKPELVAKAKPLYVYFHKYESQYGELLQTAKLEKRMAELYPEDPKLAQFKSRFSTDKFDPIAARIIVSPAAQLRPKLLPSIEPPTSMQNSPRPQMRQINSPRPQIPAATNSPKRPFPMDDAEDLNPPRKIQRGDQRDFQRGESPLKGAAGRRLDQQRRMQGGNVTSHTAQPEKLPRDLTFLLNQIPHASTYNSTIFDARQVVELLRQAEVPTFTNWKATQDRQQQRGGNAPPPAAAHSRQPSSDYPSYPYQTGNRDSPAAPGGGGARPLSPYDAGRGRITSASGTYRGSSLRPGSSGSYEPPPAAFHHRQDQPPPVPQPQVQPHYGGGPPPPMIDGGAAGMPGGWAPPPAGYGGAGGVPQQGYGAPPPQQQYGQPPPGQGGYGWGGYQY